MKNTAMYQEALTRAVTGQSVANYAAIFEGFALKGIPADQIQPRENILTFAAWKALGYHVRRGEHGVKIVTIIKTEKKNKKTGEMEAASYPWKTTVFHVSQVEKDEPATLPVGVTAELATA